MNRREIEREREIKDQISRNCYLEIIGGNKRDK